MGGAWLTGDIGDGGCLHGVGGRVGMVAARQRISYRRWSIDNGGRLSCTSIHLLNTGHTRSLARWRPGKLRAVLPMESRLMDRHGTRDHCSCRNRLALCAFWFSHGSDRFFLLVSLNGFGSVDS